MIPSKALSTGEVICSSRFSQVIALRVIVVLLLLVPFAESKAQQRWHVSLSGGVISPEFFINDSPGYTVMATFYYDMWDSTQLSILGGYNKWKESLGPGGTHFRSFPLLVGVRSPFPMSWGAPYLSGEIGLYFLRRVYTYEVYEQPNPPFTQLVSSTPASESAASLAYRFSAGTTILLQAGLEIDVRVHYQRIDYGFIYRYPQGYGRSSFYLYGIALGVIYTPE